MADEAAPNKDARGNVDPLAMFLAVGAQDEAREYLRKQSRLADLQLAEAENETKLRHWSLRFGNISAVMKVAFEIALAFIVLAVAAFIGGGVWSAAHDNGLVIEAFAVPPDLAQRGLSGEVVANQLLDKLARMQEQTNSIRPADTYRNNWGDDIKVEIPDTGISVGELNRYLRRWLGHETHITGEIYHTPAGIAVTARAQNAGQTFTGRDSDFDSLVQKAAESIYAQTQPYRYAAYLGQVGRYQQSMQAIQRFAADAPPAERAWALSLLGNLYLAYRTPEDALVTLRAGVAADPSNAHAWDNLSGAELELGRLEDGIRHTQEALSLYDKGTVALDPNHLAIIKLIDRGVLSSEAGDYQTAIGMDEAIRRLPDRGGSQNTATIDEADHEALDHDSSRAHALLSQVQPGNTGERVNLWFHTVDVAWLDRDWGALSRMVGNRDMLGTMPAQIRLSLGRLFGRVPQSFYAESRAEQGDYAGARRLIAATPADCFDCVRMRGKVEAAAKNWAGAGYWFAKAVDQAPSIPDAYSDWGEMLLRKGDYEGAIARFQVANLRGPHFADPLEMWGEALMQQNRSDLALAKFEEANKYAPNWGRLHLEWGKALIYLGRRDEANEQFAMAAQLDLGASDSAALSRWRARHA